MQFEIFRAKRGRPKKKKSAEEALPKFNWQRVIIRRGRPKKTKEEGL